MTSGQVILRHNRATADLTEYLVNTKFNLSIEEIIPAICINATVVTSLALALPVVIEMEEVPAKVAGEVTTWYGVRVSQVDSDGCKWELCNFEFDHSTMSALQAILAGGHLAGDFVKFYFKGGK